MAHIDLTQVLLALVSLIQIAHIFKLHKVEVILTTVKNVVNDVQPLINEFKSQSKGETK